MKLRKWIKVISICIIIEALLIAFLLYASERFDKIERNEKTIYEKTGN